MSITKEEFELLYSDDITLKEYNRIKDEIDTRFFAIVENLIKSKDRYRFWFEYSNCDYESEDSDGEFDIERYKEYIEIGGEGFKLHQPFQDDPCFPTRWLWEDYRDELKKTINDYKQEELKRKQTLKEERASRKIQASALKESIKKKLTKEELKLVKFKS